MDREEAIKLTDEMWAWMVKHPLALKDESPQCIAFKEQHGRYPQDRCFLCEHVDEHYYGGCLGCPYYEKYGDCDADGSPYNMWGRSRDRGDMELARTWAKEFHERIKGLE